MEDSKENIDTDNSKLEAKDLPTNTSAEDNVEPTLSKRAQKKLLKRQQWLDTKHERRAKEKEKRKRKMEERRKEGGFEESRTASRKALKHNTMATSTCKVGVVFDLQFEALMNQRDLGKTLKQVMKCYSLNRRMENPMQLYMTSFTGRVEEDMSKNEGFKNWDMNFRTARYDAALPKDKIVYLSSESEQVVFIPPPQKILKQSYNLQVLSELEADKYYVIGGLVDHNSHKGLCHKEATALGISTARLPIDQFIHLNSRKVLTVNHVFEILAAVSEGKGWKEAMIETIPERKGVAAKEVENGKELDEEDKTNDLSAEEEISAEKSSIIL